MKKEDLNLFKGEMKDVLLSWGESKIDALFPNKAAAKSLLKNGLVNFINKQDAKINKFMDMGFLFLADENGTIDTDTMIDNLKGLFKEMEVREYHFGYLDAVAGKGELVISMPNNFVLDMLVGDVGKVKFTVDDIDDLKHFFNNY